MADLVLSNLCLLPIEVKHSFGCLCSFVLSLHLQLTVNSQQIEYSGFKLSIILL